MRYFLSMRLYNFLLLILFSFTLEATTVQPHHTTAFIGQPGEFDFLFSYSHYDTEHFWNKHGKQLPAYNYFRRQAYSAYAEYAIRCQDSIIFDGGYDVIRETMNGPTLGLEDFELGWKHMIYSTDTAALTTQLIALIPCGQKRSSLRYGQPGFEADLLYSDQFCYGWYDLGLGYRYYHGFPSDQIVADAALGLDITTCWQVIGALQLEYGLFNGRSSKNFNNIVFNPNYRLLNGQIECDFRLMEHITLVLGGFKHLWGINVGAGGGIFGGAWIDF